MPALLRSSIIAVFYDKLLSTLWQSDLLFSFHTFLSTFFCHDSIPAFLGIDIPPIYDSSEVWISAIFSLQILLIKLCIFTHRFSFDILKLNQRIQLGVLAVSFRHKPDFVSAEHVTVHC